MIGMPNGYAQVDTSFEPYLVNPEPSIRFPLDIKLKMPTMVAKKRD